MTREESASPAKGAVVVDEERGWVGEVVDHAGGRFRLRPVRGGREWDADPARVRSATTGERLRANLTAVNAASSGDRAAEEIRAFYAGGPAPLPEGVLPPSDAELAAADETQW